MHHGIERGPFPSANGTFPKQQPRPLIIMGHTIPLLHLISRGPFEATFKFVVAKMFCTLPETLNSPQFSIVSRLLRLVRQNHCTSLPNSRRLSQRFTSGANSRGDHFSPLFSMLFLRSKGSRTLIGFVGFLSPSSEIPFEDVSANRSYAYVVFQ